MTVDRTQLLSYLEGVQIGMLEDGTAIGDGIATSLNRLKEGKAKSKSIILLTDGSNNTVLWHLFRLQKLLRKWMSRFILSV